MKTATEKYNAVLEGKMAKQEFVRQMRQQFPNFVSQFNGFDDSVQILKNKGMIFEAKKEKDNGYKVPEVNIPLDAIERGVDMELEAAGIDSAGNVTKEQYLEAKRKALHNLKKDMNHYINLIAKESSKVNKNDKMIQTKRGAQDKDTYNSMKKANLKEGIHDRDMFQSPVGHIKNTSKQDQEYIDSIRARFKKPTVVINGKQVDVSSIEIDGVDKSQGYDDGTSEAYAVAAQFIDGTDLTERELDMLTDKYSDVIHDLAVDTFHESFSKKQQLKETAITLKKKYGQIDGFNNILKEFLENVVKGGTKDFDKYIDGSYKMLQEANHIKVEEGIFNRLKTKAAGVGANVKTKVSNVGAAIKGDKSKIVDPKAAQVIKKVSYTAGSFIKKLDDFRNDLEKTFPSQEWNKLPQGMDKAMKLYWQKIGNFRDLLHSFQSLNPENAQRILSAWGEYESSINEEFSEFKNYDDSIGGIYIRLDELQKYIAKNEPEYIPHIEKIRRSFRNLDDAMVYGPDSQPEVDEAKKAKKDYDKDGKIESPRAEYKGSKDRAIKAAMGKQDQLKEAVKTIIKKVLTEGTINEAATATLSKYGEEYSGFAGVKQIINQLENYVTEIESFYDRLNNKVQDTFDKIGEVENEEGLKVGGFIAPAIKSAFMQDLKPVQKSFLTDIELPQVKSVSQADISMSEMEGEFEEPKRTVFSPVAESKRRR